MNILIWSSFRKVQAKNEKEGIILSAQSDIEMLSVQAMEAYAKEHGLTGNEIIEVFHEHQVFEKMLIQHEYLHQVPFEEVLEYIDKIIGEDSSEIVVYHGSCFRFETVDLQKSHNRRDFGKGFYTTVLRKQSKEWAYRLSLREKKKSYYVYEFLFEESTSLKVKRFDVLNEEWLEFIKENRSKGGLHHSYDVVIGPVADDNTMAAVQLYISNILTAEEAMNRLRYSEVNNQVSFHTKKALDYLQLVRRDDYERRDLYV